MWIVLIFLLLREWIVLIYKFLMFLSKIVAMCLFIKSKQLFIGRINYSIDFRMLTQAL